MPTPSGTRLTPRHFRHRYQPSCTPQRAQEGKGFLNAEPSAAGAEQPRGGQHAHARLLNCCCGSCEAGGAHPLLANAGLMPHRSTRCLAAAGPPWGWGAVCAPQHSPPAVETLTAPKHRGETTAVVLPPPRYPNGKPKTRHNASRAEPLPRAPDRNILDFTKV